MAKNSTAFMPLYVGDYLADTTMLTRDQHGAYLLLIMTYWRTRGPLPDNDEALAMATRSTAAEWKKLRPAIAAFFDVHDGKWNHKRIDGELSKADEKYSARVSASQKANEVRHGVRNGDRHGASNGPPNGPPNGHRHGSQSELEQEPELPPNGGNAPLPPKKTTRFKKMLAELQEKMDAERKAEAELQEAQSG